MKIGIFDSGIGGLSIVPSVRRALPKVDIIYYADVKNVPYGEKTPSEVLEYSMTAAEFLISMGAEAIVVACNTATSVAVNALREKYETPDRNIPIIGMEPAVKKALDTCRGGRVLVAATPVTVKGKKLRDLVDKYDVNRLTDALPMPMLVHLAEAEDFLADEYIKEELSSFDMEKYSALVLGCTHFNYFKDSFRRILPAHTRIVDGVDGTTRRLVSRLPESADGSGSIEFFMSGEKANGTDKFLRLLKRLEEMEKIN